MPWQPKDAMRHTKKASSPKKRRQWSDVADSVLKRGGGEGSAIRQANAVVGGTAKHGGKRRAPPKSAREAVDQGVEEGSMP
jgi:hypothetical protein